MMKQNPNKDLPRERLQKVLARSGLGSRREIEGFIEQERITLNGKLARLGDRAGTGDEILLDGKPVKFTETQTRLLLYHKPVGEICTRKDSQNRPTVFDNLPVLHGQRWVNVGRLDINTSGLLLFTNDGELANLLMHPSSEIEREYACRVHGKIDAGALKKLRAGVEIEGHTMRFTKVTMRKGQTGSQSEQTSNRWFDVVVEEGRNREVRKLWQAVGGQVSRLIRTRYGEHQLPEKLRPGRSFELSKAKAAEIKSRLSGQ